MAGRRLIPGAPAAPSGLERAAAALVASALRGVQALPHERALALGGALGRAIARVRGPRTAVARVNLRIAFPEWSDVERCRVLERSLENLGRSAAEFARLPALDDATLRALVEVEGAEHLRRALETSPAGGVVVLTGHFGSWELLVAAIDAVGFPVAVVQRPRDNPALDALVSRWRGGHGAVLLARGSAGRGALRALRDGRCLAMPIDQDCRRNEGVFVPFFGRLACTRDGPARVAMRTGAPVVPIFIHRRPDGVHHVARVRPPLALAPALPDRRAAAAENTRRMTRVIEEEIRGAPDHWIWVHRRWRTQPPGEPSPYRARRG